MLGKNRGGKEEKGNELGDLGVEPVHKQNNGNNHSLENLEVRRRGGSEMDGSIHRNHHDSDSESPTNSPTIMIGTNAGANYAGSFSGGSSSSSSSSSSGSSAGCWSESITDKEEEVDNDDDDEDGCLDDWEAMADALAADDKQKAPCSDPPVEHEHEHEHVVKTDSRGDSETSLGLGVVGSKPGSARKVTKGNTQAWRPDDAFRPQSLPNLTKHLSFPHHNWHFRGGFAWAHAAPSSCPICYEDLDPTDTSFMPCLCGFRLCLFCHKRILEEDARCPGCRKPYEQNPVEAEANVGGGSLTVRLSRTCSMITRS